MPCRRVVLGESVSSRRDCCQFRSGRRIGGLRRYRRATAKYRNREAKNGQFPHKVLQVRGPIRDCSSGTVLIVNTVKDSNADRAGRSDAGEAWRQARHVGYPAQMLSELPTLCPPCGSGLHPRHNQSAHGACLCADSIAACIPGSEARPGRHPIHSLDGRAQNRRLRCALKKHIFLRRAACGTQPRHVAFHLRSLPQVP
jgi:hypothetical protein